jgi:hypothetical protein
MHTPYTTRTGLKMGSRYQEHGITEPIDDPDMLLLQEALLATPDYIRSKCLYNIFVVLSSIVGFLLVFSLFLFR